MTDIIKAIVEKSSSDIVRYPVLEAVVSRQGARAIDTASITMPNGARVGAGDIVSYIQDDVPITNLLAIWNFQGSFRDESGFHHDGTRSLPVNTADRDYGFVYPNATTNEFKYSTNYGLDFTAADQEVTVADKNMSSHETDASLDFRGQFDIIINIKNQQSPASLSGHWNGTSNTHMILFAKYDGTNGVEVGMKKIGSGGSSKWVVYAKLDSTEFEGNGTLHTESVILGNIEYADQKATRCIRFYRDENNKARLTLDGRADGEGSGGCTQTVAVNTNNRCSDPAYIGTNRVNVAQGVGNGTNYDFKGHIFQIRVYCGGYLKESDFQNLFSAGVQQMTQKISGFVWNRSDKLDSVKVEIKSRSKTLLDSQVNHEIIDDNVASPATHTKNLFYGGQAISAVLKTIISYVDDDFVTFRSTEITSPIDLSGTSSDATFLAVGDFIRNVEVLMLLSRRSFLTFPTKTLLWEFDSSESTSKNITGYVFDDSEYQIFKRGEEDTTVINDIEVFGDLLLGYHEKNLGTVTSPSQGTERGGAFIYFPLNLQVVTGTANISDGGANGGAIPIENYEYDPHGKTLTITDVTWSNQPSSPNDYVWTKYNYEITDEVSAINGGTTKNKRHFKIAATTQQIADVGRRSLKAYIPQLLHGTDFQNIAQKIRDKFQNINRRYTIKAPFMINCLRENLQVKLTSDIMKFYNTSNGDEDLDNITLPVRSIIWKYPECTTTIEVGDYLYDLYDTGKSTNDTANNLVTGVNQTKTAS